MSWQHQVTWKIVGIVGLVSLVAACGPLLAAPVQEPGVILAANLAPSRTAVPTLSSLAVATFAAAMQRITPGVTPVASSEYCLSCHAPMEQVRLATGDYMILPDDLQANPHIPVPHDTDEIADCSRCHLLHTIPLASKQEVPKASLRYCYTMCHHRQILQPCPVCAP